MGLQVTTANKRKHDTTFVGKHVNTYTTYTSSPPIKACKWSIKNNNYVDAIEENIGKNSTMIGKLRKDHEDDAFKCTTDNKTKATDSATKSKTSPLAINSCNNKNINIETTIMGKCGNNYKESTKPMNKINCFTTLISITTATSTVAETITTTTTRTSNNTVPFLQLLPDAFATAPLPSSTNTLMPEDSIAKLEVVASAALSEPWSSTAVTVEPVDCISKLQAVAVPTDPWGSVDTRSSLATTLLNSDELDDDDDDFEDDYDEEEGIIPTYCSLRYHPFSSTSRSNSYVPSSSYGVTGPNYYSEPFPLQNCARTNNSTHVRLLGPTGSTYQWTNMNQYYVMPESAYALQTNEQQPPHQQQTIRCAENGKSYLELGCSNSLNTCSGILPAAQILHHQSALNSPPNCGFSPLSASQAALKRCCETTSEIWCAATTSNKSCYKDIRLKIRNLSMFKLSRFRQVSEQSLYRSVLICNTLKRIDREIEAEAKEMQAAAAAAVAHAHAAAAAAQHHATSYNHHNTPSTTTHHHRSSHHMQQQPHHLQQQQPQQMHQQPQHHQDYTPLMNCARLSNVDYQAPLQQQQQQQHIQQEDRNYQQHYLGQDESSCEHLDIATDTGNRYFDTSMQQKSEHLLLHNNNNGSNSSDTNHGRNDKNNSNNCDTTTATTITINSNNMHQHDHYPFRESQFGRATPYPSQFVAVGNLSSASSLTQSHITSPMIASITQAHSIATTPTVQSSASRAVSNTKATINSNNNNIVGRDSLETLNNSIDTSQPTVTATVEFMEDLQTTRLSPINWSSVLSLSSQSALDPLNNSDLFAILPPATNPAVAIPVPVSSASNRSVLSTAGANRTSATSTSVAAKSSSTSFNCSTSATFTTLSTISSATHSLTSSYVSNMSAASNSATWEYGFLDMEFGLGTEFTELMPPSCKMNSDDLFKNALTPVSTSRYSSVHENELEQPAHIMVGS